MASAFYTMSSGYKKIQYHTHTHTHEKHADTNTHCAVYAKANVQQILKKKKILGYNMVKR